MVTVVHPEIIYGTAVACHESLEAPFVAQYLLEEAVATAAGLTLEAIVGTHHLGNICFLDQGAKSIKIGLVQVAKLDVLGVVAVAVPFGSAMYGIVFGTSQ